MMCRTPVRHYGEWGNSMKYMTLAFGVAGLSMLSAAVQAHVVLEQREAPADSYYKAVFTVPHGCGDAPTTGVEVRMPERLTSVKPRPKPGWDVTIHRGARPAPVEDGHGNVLSEGVQSVAWRGGELPDTQFDTFAVMMKLPDAGTHTVLHFPVIQTCAKGENRWVETAGPGHSMHDLKRPAPSLRLTPAD